MAKATLTFQIGTGLDASGNLIASGAAEQNYSAIAGPNGENTAVAYVQPFYPGAWVPNQPTGQWISPIDPATGTESQDLGLFTYTRTIDGIGSMSGEFATDNPGELIVNGVVVVQTPGWPNSSSGDFAAFTQFNNILLDQAVNTVTFAVNNNLYAPNPDLPNPTGLIVVGTATVNAVPEPTTMVAGAMMLLPFGVGALRMLRSRRTA